MAKPFDLITMGEILLRLSPPGAERLVRSAVFEKQAGGAELNVASGVSLLGLRTGIISKLPANDLGTYIKNSIRYAGVSDDCLVYDTAPGARLGLYYYENGAAPRKPSIVYDRAGSSMTRITTADIDRALYAQARMFHTTGITLALGENVRQVALETARRFKEAGAQISFDVNYRANLWDEDTARTVIRQFLPMVDVLFISEETSRRMFRKTGTLEEIQKSYCAEYGVKIVATTQRTVQSPKKHDFTSVIYSAAEDAFYREAPYKDIDVVDRIGSGDAYCAGVLFGLLEYGDVRRALEFGNAASSVKNTIPGDMPGSDFREVYSIIQGHQASGPASEMNR
jgi:2-dehydro-3-deoxygluconokinase